MNINFKANERELVNVANFFKRKSKQLVHDGQVDVQHQQIAETVDRFIEQIGAHADMRTAILEQRNYLHKLIKDNAACPKCSSNEMLKIVGSEKNEKGWKSNRYKCRRCNIQFTWNAPNNPWDMMEYIKEKVTDIELKLAQTGTPEDQETLAQSLNATRLQLDTIKPIIDKHDGEYHDMMKRDEEMEKLIHEFKNSLLIEKIKMDTWESKSKSRNK